MTRRFNTINRQNIPRRRTSEFVSTMTGTDSDSESINARLLDKISRLFWIR
ncbi:hypothetical protein THIOM_004146 [Candidatus Thiomargarita nelsonii]|uniref:Uncharacterized protein n=1 Tax=Candidatus Thiomargarita nelsonii TaxID=1003181 RepID=A0A176RWT3_9GAMM|nr:hypothetical protein THIOM_004146 [Candidatus Thiomargarita nelsonii]